MQEEGPRLAHRSLRSGDVARGVYIIADPPNVSGKCKTEVLTYHRKKLRCRETAMSE